MEKRIKSFRLRNVESKMYEFGRTSEYEFDDRAFNEIFEVRVSKEKKYQL